MTITVKPWESRDNKSIWFLLSRILPSSEEEWDTPKESYTCVAAVGTKWYQSTEEWIGPLVVARKSFLVGATFVLGLKEWVGIFQADRGESQGISGRGISTNKDKEMWKWMVFSGNKYSLEKYAK